MILTTHLLRMMFKIHIKMEIKIKKIKDVALAREVIDCQQEINLQWVV
jgi:hypothetical protein